MLVGGAKLVGTYRREITRKTGGHDFLITDALSTSTLPAEWFFGPCRHDNRVGSVYGWGKTPRTNRTTIGHLRIIGEDLIQTAILRRPEDPMLSHPSD